jgi:hypothetical protein
MAETHTLLALVEHARTVEAALFENDGEITPEIEQMLLVTDVHLPAKIDAYQATMERFEAFAEIHKQKADAQYRIVKSCQAVVERLKENLKIAMQELGTDELSGIDTRFKLQQSPPSCVIDNEESLDAAYKTIVQTTKIDKKRILEDLKLGVPVVGAHIEQSSYIRQYANSPARQKKAVKNG